MRPASILMFERLFLASLVLSVISFFINYESMLRDLETQPGLAELGLGSGFAIGSIVVGLAIYLLLWFFIARKASSVAKWILIVLLAFSAISLPAIVLGPWDLGVVLALAVYALEVAAAAYLFRDDAAAWFKGEVSADPATFG
jgi:uncharacterized membrane protein